MLTPTQLAQARAAQEALMVDACTITRAGTPVYSGPCRVGTPQTGAPVVVAGAIVTPTTIPVTIPWDGAPGRGDRVELTASTNDPNLVDKSLWVHAVEAQTFATARRFHCGEDQ